jgi:hypothetical protein
MKIALLGYGKMGKVIEKIALNRGHEIVLQKSSSDSYSGLENADVAIDFSVPNSAVANISECLNSGIPIVSGTTGWIKDYPKMVALCEIKKGSFIYSSNFSLGVNLFFSTDNENTKNKFFIYPKVRVSYKVVGDYMIAYAGAEGELKQNSYRDFTQENPFLSPTLNIAPTDSQYDIYVGLKGKLANNIAYNVRGSYLNEKNKALLKSNNYSETRLNENYGFGNSFQVVYDNLKTIAFFGCFYFKY